MARLWRPAAQVTRGMLQTLHHGREENRELLTTNGQLVQTLHFNGVNKEPDLQQIASVLGGRSQLVQQL